MSRERCWRAWALKHLRSFRRYHMLALNLNSLPSLADGVDRKP
jgi:hypothetical protein